MNVVAGLFSQDIDLTRALQSLEKAGFHDFTVFGPDELFKEPVIAPDVDAALEEPTHKAAGTVSGISVNPRPYVPNAGAQPLEDELDALDLAAERKRHIVAGLQQNLLLLLVNTKPDRADEAEEIVSRFALDWPETVTGI